MALHPLPGVAPVTSGLPSRWVCVCSDRQRNGSEVTFRAGCSAWVWGCSCGHGPWHPAGCVGAWVTEKGHVLTLVSRLAEAPS